MKKKSHILHLVIYAIHNECVQSRIVLNFSINLLPAVKGWRAATLPPPVGGFVSSQRNSHLSACRKRCCCMRIYSCHRRRTEVSLGKGHGYSHFNTTYTCIVYPSCTFINTNTILFIFYFLYLSSITVIATNGCTYFSLFNVCQKIFYKALHSHILHE